MTLLYFAQDEKKGQAVHEALRPWHRASSTGRPAMAMCTNNFACIAVEEDVNRWCAIAKTGGDRNIPPGTANVNRVKMWLGRYAQALVKKEFADNAWGCARDMHRQAGCGPVREETEKEACAKATCE